MRALAMLSAAAILAATPASTGDRKDEWKDSRGREFKHEIKPDGEMKAEWKDGRGREFKRESKPNGDWKELRVEGGCKSEREFQNGRLKQKVDC